MLTLELLENRFAFGAVTLDDDDPAHRTGDEADAVLEQVLPSIQLLPLHKPVLKALPLDRGDTSYRRRLGVRRCSPWRGRRGRR